MAEQPLPPAILLMGPTASGKTALAVELVQRFPCDIISVDSAMVYRGLDIGTAKPGAEILAVAPHRLMDILDPTESYSAGRFRRDARAAMAEITAAGRIPLLVGGTMLYFRVLQQGLAELPTADVHLRAELDARAARLGWAALHRELARVDPAAAARVHANDPQRIQRALEVFYLTGRPMSELQAAAPVQDTVYRFVKLAVSPSSRALLHARIEQRFQAMMAAGLLAEVARLHRRGDLTCAHASMRSLGYRQLWEHLDGACDLPTALQRGIVATRRYAKRQLTWLRAESGVQWFASDAPRVASQVCAHVTSALSARA
ncbi:MAG: tRNA (adenosine(37)-N6)-dimethylallyltransferase MiaA [Gammaproteobacteria bacterium]|nr:tRNA (adenosine(37)-N6)-dimethylallyltransferase MiaA [Gammaproteobacteria bacterium]